MAFLTSARPIMAFLLTGFLGACAAAQASSATISQIPPPPTNVQILYTGELLGYLGLPDWQSVHSTECPSQPPGPDTPQGRFIAAIKRNKPDAPKAPTPTIVLGAGDNFAPAITARWFEDSVDPTRRGKDMNVWDWEKEGTKGKWVPVKSLQDWNRNVSQTVRERIEEGRGYIQNDNVGCFLKAAGYNAIVPGELDFYFGAEHLRYLARFLATDAEEARRVQMLAANLVIDTTYAKERTPLPDNDRDLTYATKSEKVKFKNLTDRKGVLPWLQEISIESEEPLSDFRLCAMNPKNPTEIEACPGALSASCLDSPKTGGVNPCKSPTKSSPAKYRVKLPDLNSLSPGNNYAICILGLKDLKASEKNGLCSRFSVYAPFFLYPNARPQMKSTDPYGQPYSDPAPYFLKEEPGKTPVAVFGVVDPNLRNVVGELNDSWRNSNTRYKTEILIIDPAEALKQQVQYFEREYMKTHGNKSFAGIKVLLAQMTSPLARQLVARFPGAFNIVIPKADSELATPNGTVIVRPLTEDSSYILWTEKEAAKEKEVPKSLQGPVNKAPSFVAVPPPYFDRTINKPVLQVRSLTISQRDPDAQEQKDNVATVWQFDVSGTRRVEELSEPQPLPIAKLCQNIKEAVRPLATTPLDCNKPDPSEADQRLKLLTLTQLKKAFHADVALMQKRDFYIGPVPQAATAGQTPAENLERILWKGDVATLVMVKGATLKKVLQESDAFDVQDNQALSLEVLRGRGLEKLGIVEDPERKEFLVNGEVLDPNRLYSVATTDYIGAGDTGYPELVEPGFDNPQIGVEFPKQLSTIARLLCTKLGENDCQAQIDRDAYLDELATVPFDRGPSLTTSRKLWLWTHIPYLTKPGMRPKESRALIADTGRAEVRAQDRRVWFLSHSSGIGLTSVKNNLSEAERQADFSAISSPSQLQAKQSHELIFTLKDPMGFRGRRLDFYVQPEINYDNVVTAKATPPADSNFKQNLLAGESVFFLHKARDYPRLGALFSIRDESQLHAPVETVTLSDPQKSSLTPFEHARTNWLLGRFGFRAQNRLSFFEGGFESVDAQRVTGFNFTGPGGSVSCPFAASPSAQDEPACVQANSSRANPTITSVSIPSATIDSAFHYGWFSNMKLVVPLHDRLSYVFTNQFDYFYAGNDSISTDMLYRDLWSNSLSFTITRNLSVAPKFDVFFYENQVVGNFFRQVQTTITLNYAFDWFSGSRWRTATRYTEPKQ